ncbi:PadR family transcriptional regulator [Actinomyces trachealis]|uniref:PadR family transcriptional regulator n=1 Tax=Actinomyces trachealis TaxID=2763540 RepID=UPI001892B456|nr:helix-turn-helix transcriptional regulator [Actinomyces trachealis]
MKLSKDLVAASATPMVLLVLSTGPDYGYSILRRIAEASDGQLEWSEGLLYPLLHRLERAGHITAQWGVADSGRRRKYYALSPDGAAELASFEAQWRLAARTISALRKAASAAATPAHATVPSATPGAPSSTAPTPGPRPKERA